MVKNLVLVVALLLLAAPVEAQETPVGDAEIPPGGAAEPADGEGEPPPPAEEPPDPTEAGFDLSTLYVPGGLSADAAGARAVSTSYSMERSRAAVAVAEAAAERAWQGVLPRLELSARYTRLSDVDQPGFGGGGGFDPGAFDDAEALIAGVDDPEARTLFQAIVTQSAALADLDFEFPVILNQYSLRASLSYPVSDLFVTILPAHEASEHFAAAERLRVESERANVQLDAREAYYAYARARGSLIVAESTLRQVEARRENISALVNAGVAARVDLMRIDAQLASARVGVARARGGVAVATHALRTLLHVDGNEPIPIGEDLTAAPPIIDDPRPELVERALEQRSELRAIRLVVSGREELVDARRGERWPSLVFQANYDFANPNNRIIPQQEEFNGTWDISAVLTWSPNDYLAANQNVSSARAELAQTHADLDALQDAVRLQVTRAYEEYQSALAALEASSAGIDAAEEAYRVKVEQLRAGTAVTSDLIDTETELTTARLQLLNAIIDARVSRA